jgi:hypothetical protein
MNVDSVGCNPAAALAMFPSQELEIAAATQVGRYEDRGEGSGNVSHQTVAELWLKRLKNTRHNYTSQAFFQTLTLFSCNNIGKMGIR